MKPRLNEVQASFDDRNAFLFAALGALSLRRRLRRSLRSAESNESNAPPPSDAEQATDHLLLGALAVGRALGGPKQVNLVPTAPPPGAAPTARPSLRELLV